MKKNNLNLPIVKGVTSTNFKTGSWRDKEPEINNEKCIKCLSCLNFCPENAISFKKEIIEIDFDFCKGCGICEKTCPVKAIKMKKI